ncbi:MAG: DUF5687 family protein [Tannerella sp.]|jgi:hypothetical protein|nr:DUF5687 family protein [Tannerella sp.]
MKKYLQLLQIEVKQFFRSQAAGENIVMTVLKVLMILYFAGILIVSLFGIHALVRETGVDIVKIFSRYFIYWWAVDLAMRYFFQQLPTQNVKPLLTLNISKKTIVSYTMLKTCFSVFDILYFLFFIPFSILLLILGYNALHVLSWLICVLSIVLANNFLNIFLNKKDVIFYTIAALTVAFGALEYFGIFKISAISEMLFQPFYSVVGVFAVPVLPLVTLVYFSYKLIFKSFYLDDGLSVKIAEGKTEDIKFLNRFGLTGTFINNDIRMIKRNKSARMIVLSCIFFLFYGLLFRKADWNSMSIFVGILVTGGFLITFGQKIPGWDSSCYPLMMTLDIPYRKYLEAKWWLMVIVTFICMIIGTLYIFINRNIFWGVIAGGFYNIGIGSLIYMIVGVFNKTPVDLNARTKAFGNGNTMNMKILLLTIPNIALPVIIYFVMQAVFNVYLAVITITLIGLIGFILRNKAFDFIVKLYKKEKYSTINAFRKIE